VIRTTIVNGRERGEVGYFLSSLPAKVKTLAKRIRQHWSEVSLDNSGVPYASNRVTSLTLKAVRWYSASGVLLQQNTTPQAVHPQN
jgi:hypothetical protein